MGMIDLKNCTILLVDGSVSPNSVEINIGEGNITWDEMVERQYIKNRGRLDEVRNGDEMPMDVTLTAKWTNIKSTGSEAITPVEAVKKTGAASGWKSSDSDLCRPYAVDIEVHNIPVVCPGTKAEVTILPDFRYEKISFDPKAGTISLSGKCNATEAVSTRESQTSAA